MLMVGGLLMSDYQTINPKVNIKSNRIIFEEGKRQGALEELKKFKNEIELVENRHMRQKLIHNITDRIKELKERGEII